MYDHDDNAEHEAVTRLFELTRSGDTGNCEYNQLDSMIYDRLEQAYGSDDTGHRPSGAIQVQTAAS
ncbi:hypothetical protein [Luteimonas lutimaris]|uniref:Uncharacterized protein n=1 Tax=Luteimonas lutimaris TaxID=698645 RepID=A0ABP7MVL4_9GAMM